MSDTMNDTKLRSEAIGVALSINSPCDRPCDRVGDLIKNAQDIFEYVKTGTLPKHEKSVGKEIDNYTERTTKDR